MLLDAKSGLHDSNTMDVGYAGEDSHCWLESGMENHDVVWVTLQHSEGKRREDKGHDRGTWRTGGKGWDKGKGPTYSHCGKRGHDPSRCWTLHPEKLFLERTRHFGR